MTWENLDGWELVDSMDGRRFFGRIVDRDRERVFMEPALEIFPPQKSLHIIPRQNTQAMIARGGQPQVEMVPQWFASQQLEFSTILDLPFLGKYDTIRCGGTKLVDLPHALRAELLKMINACAKSCERNLKELSRANGTNHAVE